MNLLSRVHRQATEKSSVWRFPEQKRALTLREIDELAARFAGALLMLGVRRGDRVGLLLPNCSEYPSLLLAVWRCGAIAVPLRAARDALLEPGGYLCRVQADCRCSVLIFADDVTMSVLEYWRLRIDGNAVTIAQLIERASDTASVCESHEQADSLAVIQYSSGSTGAPKGVMVTHRMIDHQVSSLAREFALAMPPLRAMASWLPFNHDMGLFIGILVPLFLGIENTLASPRYYVYKPHRWFKHMSDFGVNLIFTTSSAMASSLDSLSRLAPNCMDLSRFHMLFGAEKVSPHVLRSCYELLGRQGMARSQFFVGYGMSENALGATITKKGGINVHDFSIDESGSVRPRGEQEDGECLEIASIGSPFEDVRITVRDSNDVSLGELRLGEIAVEGPCVTPGYYCAGAAAGSNLRDGRLYTGDLGFHYEGELYFHSRKDELIVANGRNIVPDDIEEVVEQLSFIRIGTTVLFGIESDAGITELHLVVEQRGEADEVELARRRRTILKRVVEMTGVLIDKVLFCERGTVEKTSSGKKRRKVVAKKIALRKSMVTG